MGSESSGSKDLQRYWHLSSQWSNRCVLFQIFRLSGIFMRTSKKNPQLPLYPSYPNLHFRNCQGMPPQNSLQCLASCALPSKICSVESVSNSKSCEMQNCTISFQWAILLQNCQVSRKVLLVAGRPCLLILFIFLITSSRKNNERNGEEQ